MLSKLKSKLVSYCDDHTPVSTGGMSGSGTEHSKVVMPGAVKPITCSRNQGLFVSVFYVLGPGGWLILHISWILVVVLYSKALRRRYPEDEATKVLPYHNNDAPLYQDPAPKQGYIRPNSPPMGAWNSIHRTFSSHSQIHAGKGKDTEMGVMGVHPYQTHPFQDAPYQQGGDKGTLRSSGARASSALRNPFKLGSTDLATQQRRASDLKHIDSDSESCENSDDDGSDDDDDQDALARGRQQSRKHGSTSTVSTGMGGEIPADGKGWWLRQIEGKKRGEFCPCMNASELRVAENEACWCGKERRESHARLSVASGSASGSGSGSRPSPSFSAARAISPAGPSSRPRSSNVGLPREPSPAHHRAQPRQS